jgi:hypothetical protein
MLWLEREVVASLSADVDPAGRAAIEAYVEGVLRDKPDHLRMGVAGEAVVLGTGIRHARLLSSLTIFAIEELAPSSSGPGTVAASAAGTA